MLQTIFTGAGGDIYYSSLNIIVMTLLMLLSIRLLVSRQKRAYLTLTACMGLMLIGQLILLGIGLTGSEHGKALDMFQNLLNTASFILGNVGIYQLYGETTKRVMITYYCLLAGTLALSIIPIASVLYEFALVVLAFIAIKPIVEQSRHYQTCLTFYGIATAAHATITFTGDALILHLLDNLCRIAFFATLFVILFAKVLTLMESSYNKSTRDALTGLFNRFYFYTTVSFLVSEQKPISVIFFDLDNFKKLNDTRGHEEGDKALKAVASILREEAEEIGLAGRYGGEEMVLVVDDPDVNMGEFAEKVRERIETETIVTASIGFATWQEGDSCDELIKKADQAMYKSKKSGKNRVTSYAAAADIGK
ncbi:GGDEF domain-containing protein [Paenibacillus gansuensis]|uniref:GGDEF domain-containing protein n=1 Tax=Paenibacillus gansuensis TaxID=306542 RepID=A0ABW5PIR9_9BACL